MIGSISKVRPAGHHHYYKYAHARNHNDMNRIAASKSKTYCDGELTEEYRFYYPLASLTQTSSGMFGNSLIKIFDDNLSKVGWAEHMFTGSKLEKINIENYAATGAMTAVPGIQMKPEGKVDYKVKFYNATVVTATFQQTYIRKGSNIQLYAPKATNMSNIFSGYGGGGFEVMASSPNINIEIDCRNAVSANSFGYYNPSIDELDFPIDEDGNHTFGSGKPEVGRLYTTFPKLKQGKDMFYGSRLSRNYVLAILNDLPDWSNDTAIHEITLGIHVDNKYDPEVNIALKKCQNNYVTPIEEYGASLPEEITTDKGWSLTVQWNGTATSSAYPPPPPSTDS